MQTKDILTKLILSIKSGNNNETENLCNEIRSLQITNITFDGKNLLDWITEIYSHNYDYYPIGILQEMDRIGELSEYLGYTIFDIGQNSTLPVFDTEFSVQLKTPIWSFDDYLRHNIQKLISALEQNDEQAIQEIQGSEIWEDVFYETLDKSAPVVYSDISFIIRNQANPGDYSNILKQISESKSIQEFLKNKTTHN